MVAVVRTEHFGDIVAVEPLSREVRNLHPDAHVVWFVKPVFRELVEVNPHIDEVFPEFCVTQREVILKSGVFDHVYELQFRNNNHCPTCQKFYDNPIAVAKNIDVFNYFEFGNLLEVFAEVGDLSLPADQQPRLYLQESHLQKAASLGLPQGYIVVHCQSNFAPKDWPAENWEKLVKWLIQRYRCTVVEVGLKSNLNVDDPRYVNLTGRLSILETGAVIRGADFFIGLDSGPAHLANAVETYGFVLMGTLGNFETYNPYSGKFGSGENCTIIREPGKPCAELSLERVTRSIRDVLPSEVVS
ncbi:glycosyltransferase family 9 protein [Ravibacter arvi]|uniref:Glycosyltransferase family 9 protein n=1 Tax=Ravibacter arvi TaxID=2051041 RepID=A0ABP8LVL7_9BACT